MLYDAVAILAARRRRAPPSPPTRRAKDFVTDAFAHCKFIGLGGATDALVEAAGLTGKLDDACPPVGTAAQTTAFVARIAGPREWGRDLTA